MDISPFTQVDDLIREVTRRRAGLKELTGRPNMVRLVLNGAGPLHKAVATEEGREFILQALNDKEQFRFLFAYFSRLEDHTRPLLDLKERRELPDVMGNYLKAYDAVNDLPAEERKVTLRALAEKQPEFVKYKKLLDSLSDDALLSAWRRAELLGAEMLSEEVDDENH